MFSELLIGNSWASLGGIAFAVPPAAPFSLSSVAACAGTALLSAVCSAVSISTNTSACAVGLTASSSTVGPGNWNDDDMLEVGNKGLSIAEQRTHMSLWCLVKSPLLIGSDVRSIAPESLALLKNKELISINQDELGIQAVLAAVYHQSDGPTLLQKSSSSVLRGRDEVVAAARRELAFATNSSSMTTCGEAPAAHSWRFVAAINGSTIIQSTDGQSCLASNTPLNNMTGVVPCNECEGGTCHWDTASGYSGENGNKGRANQTTAQIKSKVDGRCLEFSAASRGGRGLYMESCNSDPDMCIHHRCYYSASLGDEEWYLSDNGQLIASFVPRLEVFLCTYLVAIAETGHSFGLDTLVVREWAPNPSTSIGCNHICWPSCWTWQIQQWRQL